VLAASDDDADDGGEDVIINGIDYPERAAELEAQGIDPFGHDDRAFGVHVYCNQHRRVHATGWCGVTNIEKRVPTAAEMDVETDDQFPG
jgi:hypothetical protein